MSCPTCGAEMQYLGATGVQVCYSCGTSAFRGTLIVPTLVAAVKAADEERGEGFMRGGAAAYILQSLWAEVRRCAGLEEKRKVPK